MHIQARARVKSSSLGGGIVDADPAPYTLSEVLGLLAKKRFSLRSASGYDIERGGQFSFRVHAKPGGPPPPDPDEEDADDLAVREAIAFLQSKGVECEEVRVFHRDLADQPGALKAFVDHVTDKGYPVVEISIATPNPDGTIPVQIYAGETLPEGVS